MAAPPRLNSEIGKVEGSAQRVLMGEWLYQFLVSVGHNPTQTVTQPTIGASPYVYTNDSKYSQDVFVSGGTVSAIEFGRGGLFYPAASGVQLSPNDVLRVTYSVAPTLTVVPR